MENMGKGFLNEGAFSSKRLRERMQSFAWADAKLCVGGCKALRGRLQSFALAHAMLCFWDGQNWHRRRRHGRIETIIGGST